MRHRLMQADLRTMRSADLADDSQPQAGATALCAASIEAFEHLVALLFGNARPIVFDFQYRWRQTRSTRLPPGGVYARALSIRLLSSSLSKVGSPSTQTGCSASSASATPRA